MVAFVRIRVGWPLLGIALVGCGRVGFDDYPSDAARSDVHIADGARSERANARHDAPGVDSFVTEASVLPDGQGVATHDSGADVTPHDSGPDVTLHDSGVDAAAHDSSLDAPVNDSAHDSPIDGAPHDSGTDGGEHDAPSEATTPTFATFTYTGAAVPFVVPAGVTSLTVKLWGAGGGSSGALGGNGGFVAYSALAVTPGETLTVLVGQGGSHNIGVNPESFGGGGAGSSQPMYAWTGAGGGRSALQRAGADIMTSGGGGGTGYGGQTGVGGAGCGGTAGNGGDGQGPAPGLGGTLVGGGAGASAAAPGANGSMYQGGDGANQWSNLNVGAGGGGGYYGGGGGGGTESSQSGAGGGGSCYGPAGTVFDGTGGVTDPDNLDAAGQTSGNNPGNPGRVVIRW